MNGETTTALKPKILGPNEGKELCAFGDTIVLKLSGEDTGGALALGFGMTPPGGGPPLHRHTREDEIFIVTKGRFQYTADGAVTECGPGSVVFLPKGCTHTFKCISEEPGETIVITTPSGFDSFFTKCAEQFTNGAPDMAKIVQIATDHGLEFVPAE